MGVRIGPRPFLAILVCSLATLWPITRFAQNRLESRTDAAAFDEVRLPPAATAGAALPEAYGIGAKRISSWRPAAAGRPKALPGKPWSAGGGAAVYERAAPAIVVVRTEFGHGTGFVMDPAGWLLTNEHVVSEAALDPTTGAAKVVVHTGTLVDGIMQVREEGHPALVYKTSKEKDLALVKLVSSAAGVRQVPFLPLSPDPVALGTDCVVIGHPRAAMLWSLRTCEVSGVGTWPQEMISVVMERLRLTGSDRNRMSRLLDSVPRRKVVVSTCGVNPGDSGGPLVDSKGQVIGVTFAIPKGGTEEGISLDKFAYHVHLDEVRDFLSARPGSPIPWEPDPWPPALLVAFEDLDGDGTAETAMFGSERAARPAGLLIDLDQNSRGVTPDTIADPAKRSSWDFEFAFHWIPEPRVFYDTDGDGRVDLLLVDDDEDPEPDAVYQRTGDRWTASPVGARVMFDPSYLPDRVQQKRLATILRALAKGR